jgi:hypothetical protein
VVLMKKWIAFSILCFALLVPVLHAAYPNEFPLYLGMLGFRKSEIERISDGGIVTHSLYNKLPGEYGIVSAIVQNAPVYYFRDYYQYIENFRSLNEFQSVGKFQSNPGMQELMALQFTEGELRELLNCRTHCTIQLSAEEISTIPPDAEIKTEQGKARVMDVYRQILLNRLLVYQKGGTAALASYAGSADPQSLQDILRLHLYKFPYLTAYFPIVKEQILGYPEYIDPETINFFFWSKDHLGNKPVVNLRHVMIFPVGEDYLIVNKLIYSNHYFLSSLGIIHLINYANKTIPRTLLVYDQRSLTDLEGDPVKALGRNILRSNLEKKVAYGFESVTKEIELRYTSRWFGNFPFGLLPRDQR